MPGQSSHGGNPGDDRITAALELFVVVGVVGLIVAVILLGLGVIG